MFAPIIAFALRLFASRLFMPAIASIMIGVIFTTGYVKGNNACVAKQTVAEQKMEQKSRHHRS